MKFIHGGTRLEAQIFLVIFLLIFTSLVFVTGRGANVFQTEQWINLTNEMFYGKNDFLFSYGPLYWLTGGAASQYSKITYWIAVVFVSSVNAVFWSAIGTLAYQARNHLLLAFAFVLFFGSLKFPGAMYLWPFAIAAYLDVKEPSNASISLKVYVTLGIFSALAIYVRFLYGFVALATFGTYFLSRIRSRKDFFMLGAFLATAATGYFIIGLLIFHHDRSLVDYLIINNQLSFGNSVDMTLHVANSRTTLVIVAFVAVALNVYTARHRRNLWLTVNTLLLLFIKLGFSRADSHYLRYFIPAAVTLALLVIFENKKFSRYLFIIIIFALYILAVYPSYPGAAVKSPLLNTAIDFGAGYNDRMASAYPDFKLEKKFLQKIRSGTVDVYPYRNEYVFANKLNYIHRPVFQGFMTLTPRLDLMNERFFESSHRPDYVLWTGSAFCQSATCNPFDDFDGKYVLNEDPLTSSAILLNYHVVAVTGGRLGAPVILMAANKTVSEYSERAVGAQHMEFGKWYKVPSYTGGVLKVKPHFELTLYARAKNLLFRGNIVWVKYRLKSGEILTYRLNILNSRDGVFVSPLPDSPDFGGTAPEFIRFETDGSWYFEPQFSADWVTVPVAGVNVTHSRSQSLDDWSKAPPKHHLEKAVPCAGSIDFINDQAVRHQTFQLQGPVSVHGWLALSPQDGELFDKIFLVIKHGADKKLYVSTHIESREDVSAAYHKSQLTRAGFVSNFDISSLKGKSDLGLAAMKGSTLYDCSRFDVTFRNEQ